jgi:hypothetical protein
MMPAAARSLRVASAACEREPDHPAIIAAIRQRQAPVALKGTAT